MTGYRCVHVASWVLVAALASPAAAQSDAPLLPEIRKSPLLWTLRGCHALLQAESVGQDALDACFAQALQQVEAFADEPELEAERQALVAFLKTSHVGVSPRALTEQLTEVVEALRSAAGRVRASRDSALVLISQGGISLGSWQAGVLYAVTEHLKRKRSGSTATIPTVTGASAGAVNGLISASASCEKPVLTPEESLFYKIWIELGVVGRHGTPGLLGDQAQTYGLFNEGALQFAMTQAREHFAESSRYVEGKCAVQLGLTVTHLDANDVPVHQNAEGEPVITGPNLREQFALSLDFSPDNALHGPSALVVHNFVPRPQADTFLVEAPAPRRFPLLGDIRRADAALPVDQLMQAVRASGAFPGAFAPVKLPFSRLSPEGKPSETKRTRFIDGGVFDNTPVGLAIELDDLRKRAAPAEAAPTTLARAMVPDAPTTYLLIEPSAISWTLGNRDALIDRDAEPKGIVETYAGFASQFIGSSRSAALVETIRRWPFLAVEESSGLQSRMIAPLRNMPIAGEQLGAFLGFLERDFRIFDFYVGMADAAAMLDRDVRLGASDHKKPVWSAIKSPELACMRKYYEELREDPREITVLDLPYECRSIGRSAHTAVQGKIDASDVRAGLARPLSRGDKPSAEELALSAANFKALLVAAHNYRLWTQLDAENIPGARHYDAGYAPRLEFDVFFDKVVAAGYTFMDLPRAPGGSDVSTSEDARRAVRRLMQAGIKNLAAEQPADLVNYAGIHVLGRAAADQYHILRPDWMFGIGLVAQGFEVVGGRRFFSDSFRLDLGLRFFRFDSVTLDEGEEVWKLDSALSLQLVAVQPLFSFLDLEVSAGPVASLTHALFDRFVAADRVGAKLALGATFIQRFYVAPELEWFPHTERLGKYGRNDVPIVRNWRWAIAAGFRFMW